jgi:hypothetical protein
VRTLEPGQPVVGFLHTSGLAFFDETGTRVSAAAAGRERRNPVGV